MSNDYIPNLDPAQPGTVARSSQLNERYENTVSGFDKLPNPAVGRKGFGEPVHAPAGTQPDELTTKGYVDTGVNSGVVRAETAAGQAEASEIAASQSAANALQSEQNAAPVNAIVADITALAAVQSDIQGIGVVRDNISSVVIAADNISDINTFTAIWLGSHAADPTTRKDGSALQEGDLYFNTAGRYIRVFNSVVWDYQVQSEDIRNEFQSADANLQAQISSTAPLEASAFSPISWHEKIVGNSVTIPDNKNAWSFGPEMTVSNSATITIGQGSSWTIANGTQQGA